MDKKVSFLDFMASLFGMGIAIVAIVFGLLLHAAIKNEFPSWANGVAISSGLAFYISVGISAVIKHNENVKKNIEDRKKEK